MHKIKFHKLIFTFVFISGCSSTWYHPTLTENDFYKDQAYCDRYASSVNPDLRQPYDPYLTQQEQASKGAYDAGSQLARGFGVRSSFKNCMYGKGYRDNK